MVLRGGGAMNSDSLFTFVFRRESLENGARASKVVRQGIFRRPRVHIVCAMPVREDSWQALP